MFSIISTDPLRVAVGIFGTVLIAVIIHLAYFYVKVFIRYPRGPIPLPIVGNTLLLKRQKLLHEVLLSLEKDYGYLFTFWIGQEPVVIITNPKEVRKVLQSKSCSEVKEANLPLGSSGKSGNYQSDINHQLINTSIEKMNKLGSFYPNDTLSFDNDFIRGTLCWWFVLAANYPVMQDEIRKELEFATVKENDNPAVKCPYTMAFLCEVMRYRNIFPCGIPLKTTSSVTIGGHKISPKTIILPMAHRVHMDDSVWKDPQIFRPKRFLDDNNNLSINNDNFIPLGRCDSKTIINHLFRIVSQLVQETKGKRFAFAYIEPGMGHLDGDVTLGNKDSWLPVPQTISIKKADEDFTINHPYRNVVERLFEKSRA